MDQRSASQQHEATTKPPRPFSSTKRPSGQQAAQASNIQRLLKNQGSEDDPLAQEHNNYNTSQTEVMGGGQHSDFMEEDANQYMMTKFKDENGQRRAMPVNISRGSLTKQANAKTIENLSSHESMPVAGPRVRINSTLNMEKTPQHVAGQGTSHIMLNSGYDQHRGSDSFPASAINQHTMQIVNPMTPSDGLQTQGRARISSFIKDDTGDLANHDVQVEPNAFILNSEKTLVGGEGRISSSSMPQAQVAVLPSGVMSGKNQLCNTSEYTQETQQLGQHRISNNIGGTPINQLSQAQAQNIQIQHSLQDGKLSQGSKTASEGQKTVVVPPVFNDQVQLRISQEQQDDQHAIPQVEQQKTLKVTLAAQILTGEAQTLSSNEATQHLRQETGHHQKQKVTPKADGHDFTNHRILTDCQPEQLVTHTTSSLVPSVAQKIQHSEAGQGEILAEQVQSAEFAMSTFNILNNKEMALGQSSEEKDIRALLTQEENKSENAARCTTEEITGAVAANVTNNSLLVQRAHILSGTRELKQSNSQMTGHVADTTMMSNQAEAHQNPPLVDPDVAIQKEIQSKTQLLNYNKNTANDRPNKPLEQHFDAVDLQRPSQLIQNTGKPQVNEQVVYSRLPKNYFMEEAQEQMDIDIAINDIKQLRQGFISYVNDQGVPAEQDDLEQIDDFLDPSKFMERHFGAENPDIIFQEVMTQVPDPPMSPKQEEDMIYEERQAQIKQDDSDQEYHDNQAPGSSRGGGFTEQNVTPIVPDMWADNLTDEPNREIVEDGKQVSQPDGNLITGETFLKDARQIDQSIEEMNAVAKTVESLMKPYNDNEMAAHPENANIFSKLHSENESNNQMITIAIESQEAILTEQLAGINESQIGTMAGLDNTFENTEDPMRCAQSEDNIGDYVDDPGVGQLSQQRVFAMNQDHQQTTTLQKAKDAALEVNVTKRRRKVKGIKFESGAASNQRQPVKVLRMADYFKPSHATLSALNLSAATTADNENSMKDQSQMGGLSEFETIAQENKMKEELDAKLEQDILDNVDVNFIFNKGTGLTNGLIDPDRIFSVMNKLKELAYKQLQSGSNQINYAEIVTYLKDSEGFFADEIVQKEERMKLYVGEADIDSLDKGGQHEQTQSIQQITNEPVLIGLGDNQDEKNRRWGQCMNFLRNNPKLLLQMIPDPDDDLDNFSVGTTTIGKPRPTKRQANCRPPKTGNKNQIVINRGQKTRFLAMSQDKRNGPAANSNMPSQKPIKVRQNALRGKVFSARRISEKQTQNDNISPYVAQEVDLPTPNEGPEGKEDHIIKDNDDDDYEEGMDMQLNIQTIPTEISNLNNQGLNVPKLPLSTPETTKVSNQQKQELLLEGYMQINDNNDNIGGKPQTMARGKRQQSAVTRTTTQKLVGDQRRQGSTADLRTKNSLKTKISVFRGYSGKNGGQMEGNNNFMGPMERFNSVMCADQDEKYSFTTTPSGNTTMYRTTGNKGFPKSRGYNTNNFMSQNNAIKSMFRRPVGHYPSNDRNQNENDFYGSNSQNPRAIKSNNNMYAMTRVFSDAFSNRGQARRPITAVQGPSLTQAHGIGRRRLASNSILNINAQHRSSTRRFLYNKQNYQTNGLDNVQSAVVADLQARKTAQNTIFYQEGPQSMNGQEGPNRHSNRSPQSQGELEAAMQSNQTRQQAASAAIPSIFRQSNEEAISALSAIQQDGQFFYYDGATSQHPEQKILADASSQYCPDDHQIEEPRRTIEVQTEIQDVNGDLSPPPKAQDRSLQSHLGVALQAHIDWAYTPLCIAVLNKKEGFNQGLEKRVFVEAEVDVVLQMIKSKFHEYNQTDKLAPYHGKALETLKELLIEQGLEPLVHRFERQYLEITVENTIKMLLRSKLVFSARLLFLQIFDKILRYEVASQDAKLMIESKETYKLPLQELNELRLKCGRMYETGEKVLHEIRQLRADRKGQYSQPFIFKKKDLTLQIKNEVAEVRQLVKIYRVKRQNDSEDSDKPARFVVVTDDEVSEREEVRDSNYIGTDLYWENRFYEVKPFKKPGQAQINGNEMDMLKIETGESVEMKDGGMNSEDINDKEFVMV